MLGIIIGVGAVIAMIAVGSGAKAQIVEHIASMGSNLLIVRSEIYGNQQADTHGKNPWNSALRAY